MKANEKMNANATEHTAQTQEERNNTIPPKKTRKQHFHDMEEAAKSGTKKIGSGLKKGAGVVGKGVREGMIDIASLGISVVVGDAVSTAANNAFIVGSAAANSGFNALTGRGTVNVKGKFGGWKTMSLADYTAAVNRGVKFKDAEANFFVNRHAKEFNAAGKIIGGVAGGTAGVGTFIGSREALSKVTRTKGERELDEYISRQNMAAVIDDTVEDVLDAYYGIDSSSSNSNDDEDEE